ncbi:MAG: T9SS type A sorting domain-containing protein, partial [Bacteroidetes bacterium]|nr:T9SS type A sorting domain-containing protein [Bacteroidota bacterium]
VTTDGPIADEEGCGYSQTWTANVTDACGNAADPVSITYTWTVDTEAPVITTNGQSGDLGCNPEITPPEFKVIDNCMEGELPLVPTTEGPIADDEGCGYSQTWTANYTDNCLNEAIEVSVTYTWTVDTEAPIIKLPEVEPICEGAFPKELTAEWTDNCSEGGVIIANPTNIIVSECQETADYVFTVTDDCGNTTTEKITVIREFDVIGECETAFARSADHNVCFIPDFNRWGWTNYFENEGTYSLDLYAGAAHCEIDRGALAGEVIVTYLNGEVTVEFNIGDGYIMNEAHVYIGCEKFPIGNNGAYTVAPGQYNFNPGELDGVNNYTVGPVSASGPIFIIAHAVTCELICSCSNSEDDGGVFAPSDYDVISCEENLTGDVILDNEVDFTAYPVPYDQVVSFKYAYDYETDIKVEVFDARGVVVRKDVNNNYVRGTEGVTRIDLSGTENQFFFVRLTTSRGSITKKIISNNRGRKD